MALSLCINLDDDQRSRLLEVARASILHGLEQGGRMKLETDDCPPALATPAAVFVTLTHKGALRGCIGSLQASQPLIKAVAEAASNAAFRDRRFAPLAAEELDEIKIEISVLSPMEPIDAVDRASLLQQLQPGVDGLLIEDRGYRATFLPQVWEKIGSASEFLDQLLRKAGLAPGYWSGTIRCHRYHSLSFAEE